MKKQLLNQCEQCGESIGFKGICYSCRARNQREAYQTMTIEEVERMIRVIVEWDQIYLDFSGLLGYHDINTARIAQAAFDKEIFYPAALYRDASPDVRDQLLACLFDPKCEEAELQEMSRNQLILGAETVPMHYAGGGDEVITIGGLPDWVQDAQFATCPGCDQTMKLLAALPWDVLLDRFEGTLYIEICTDCRTLSLFHQQT